MIPFLIFSLAAIGLNLLTGYTGPAVARHRRVHGGGRLCLLQADDGLSGREHHRLDRRVGLRLGAGRRDLRPADPAHQGLLPRGRDARRAVLPAMVLRPHSLALQLQRLGRDRGADADAVRRRGHRPDRHAVHALFRRARDRRGDDLARFEPGSRPHRPHVDGGARHGHRRRADGHPAAADQAARLRGVVVLLRRRRCAAGVPLVRQRRGRGASTSTRASYPVHGDHRRARQLVGSFFGAALIFILPILLRCGCRMRSACRSGPRPSSTCTFMIVGALIIFFLIVEPQRPRAALADREAETEGVAFPVLIGQTGPIPAARVATNGSGRWDSPAPGSGQGIEAKWPAASASGRSNGRNAMRLKGMILGAAIGALVGAPAFVSHGRRRRTSIYVPLF